MEVTLKSQFIVILYSILFGAFLGVIYHLLSIISNVFKFKDFEINNKKLLKYKLPYKETVKSRIGLFFIDLLYFLIITPLSAIFVFGINSGVVRGYIIVGAICGFLIYKLSLGRIFGLIVNYSSLFFQNVLLFQIKLIMKPIKAIKKLKKKKVKKKMCKTVFYFLGKTENRAELSPVSVI